MKPVWTIGRDHKLSPVSCPYCGTVCAGTFGIADEEVDDVRPRRGAHTICAACGGFAIFTRGLKLRQPTKAELRQIENSDPAKIAAMVQAKIAKRRPS